LFVVASSPFLPAHVFFFPALKKKISFFFVARKMGAVLSLLINVLSFVLSIILLPVKLAVRIKNRPAREVQRRLALRDFTRNRPAATFGRYERGQKFFDVSPQGELQLPIASEGIGSFEPITILEAFETAVKRHGKSVALQWQPESGAEFVSWTWEQYYNDTLQVAKALIHLGLKRFESVNIIGFNSPQWFLANLGAIFAGGKAAGIYSTNDADACEYIATHSEARVVVVEDAHQLAKFVEVEDKLVGNVAAYVVYNPSKAGEAKQGYSGAIPLYTWSEFLALGDKTPDEDLHARMSAQRPGHCCTLIYTSGTTGRYVQQSQKKRRRKRRKATRGKKKD
jgi:AMP-binding enzyme